MADYESVQANRLARASTTEIEAVPLTVEQPRKIGDRKFLPFRPCFCVQDTPQNPCPCMDTVFWILESDIYWRDPLDRQSGQGDEMERLRIRPEAQILAETEIPMNARDASRLIREATSRDGDGREEELLLDAKR